MQKRAALTFTLLALTACFLSYKLGSAPVALAKSHPAQQEIGAAPPTLPTAPATWTLSFGPAGLNTAASVTQPAGGAGVKHVASCIAATLSIESPGNSNPNFNFEVLELFDGTPTTGRQLLAWNILQPVLTTGTINVCGLNVVGSPNTPMTLGFRGNPGFEVQAVNLVGYDAQ
jgi:hypothetical protein